MQPDATGVASRRVLAPQRHARVDVFLRVSVEIFDDQRPQRHFLRRRGAAGRKLLSEDGETRKVEGKKQCRRFPKPPPPQRRKERGGSAEKSPEGSFLS